MTSPHPATETVPPENEAPPIDDVSEAVGPAASSLVEPYVEQIDIARIARPNNHRLPELIDKAKLDELADSIRMDGQLEPIRVYELSEHQARAMPGKDYLLGFGYRRVAAAELLGYEVVRAEIYPPATDDEIAEARAVENLHRQDLNVMEEALAVSQLFEDRGGLQDEHLIQRIALRLAKSVSWVRDRLYMSRLSDDVKKLAFAGLLLPGHLRELAKVGDEVQQLQIALRSLNGSQWYSSSLTTQKQRDKQVADVIESQSKGRAHRATIEELRKLVEESKRSLRLVPWDLDVAFAGCAACIGCPHNTATDQTLFAIAPDDKGNGFCMKAACFEQKTKASEKAKAKVVTDLKRKKLAPTAEAVDQVKPTWLNRGPAQRVAKKELDPPKAKGGKAKAAAAKKEDSKPKETPRSRWGLAVHKWHSTVGDAIEKYVSENHAHAVGMFLLERLLDWQDAWRYHPENRIWTPKGSTTVPVELTDKALGKGSPRLSAAIALAVKAATDSHLIELADAIFKDGMPEIVDVFQMEPWAMEQLAHGLDIEIPPMPQLKDFEAAEPAKDASSPKEKSKSKRAPRATKNRVVRKKAGAAKK